MGCSVVVVLCFACLVCLCLMVTPRYLSHLFSHMGELSIETKRIDDRQSFKRVRHRQKKKLRRYIILGLQVTVQHQKVFEVHYLMELHRFHLIQHHLQFRLGLRPQFSLQVQHLWDCRALQEGCLMLEVL